MRRKPMLPCSLVMPPAQAARNVWLAAPAQRWLIRMMASVFCLRTIEPQVLNPIICLDPVDVMDDLFVCKQASNMAFHDESVFKNISFVDTNQHITTSHFSAAIPCGAVLTSSAFALKNSAAFISANGLSILRNFAWPFKRRFLANCALNFDSRHAYILPAFGDVIS